MTMKPQGAVNKLLLFKQPLSLPCQRTISSDKIKEGENILNIIIWYLLSNLKITYLKLLKILLKITFPLFLKK